MKKVFGLIGFLALIISGTAFAQTSQQHDVTVTIPSFFQIRMVDGSGTPVTGALDSVDFDYNANAASFIANTMLPPTNTGFNWDDVEVSSNDGAWEVTLQVSGTDEANFAWGTKVGVDANTDNAFDFNLADDAVVDAGTGSTSGWESLGFGPDDFRVRFDGTEAADATGFTVTVTYTIAAP